MKVGVGNKLKFWEDRWIGDEPLNCGLPRLYMISNSKDQTIGQIGSWDEGTWKWNLTWRRARRVWEIAKEEQLVEFITRKYFNKGSLDTWTWKEDDKGVFIMKSAYNILY